MRRRLGFGLLVTAVALLILALSPCSAPDGGEEPAPAGAEQEQSGIDEGAASPRERPVRRSNGTDEPTEESTDEPADEDPATRTVTIEVQDPEGAPVTEAYLIRAPDTLESISLYGMRRPYHPPPSEAGLYDVSVDLRPGIDLVIAAAGFRPARIEGARLAAAEGPIVVQLERGAAMIGVVQDPWGVPVEGAEVSVAGVDVDWEVETHIPGPGGIHLSGGATRTDRDGRFAISGLVADQPHAIRVRKAGYLTQGAGTSGPVPGDLPRPIVLEPLYVCRWIAVNATTRERIEPRRGWRMKGQGLRRVSLVGNTELLTRIGTDDAHTQLAFVNRRRNWDGARIDLANEGIVLDLSFPGYEDTTVSLPFERLAPDGITTHEVPMQPTAVGFGTVRFAPVSTTGSRAVFEDVVVRALRPLRVSLTGEHGTLPHGLDFSGQLELRGIPAGHYELTARPDAGALFRRDDGQPEFTVVEPAEFDVPINGVAIVPLVVAPRDDPHRGKLVVKVLGPDGLPEEHARVSLSMRRGSTMGGGSPAPSDGEPTSEHRFLVLDGEVTVRAAKLGYEPASAKATIAAGKTTTVTLQLFRAE